MEDDAVKARAFIAIATFIVGFLSAIAPLKVIRVDAHLFSVGNLMASGVLLAAGIVHQLPDSIEKFRSISLGDVFPVAPFVAGLTFCLFLLLEEYIHTRFADHPIVTGGHNHRESDSGYYQHRGQSNNSHNDDKDCGNNDHNGKHHHGDSEGDPLLLSPPSNHVLHGRPERSATVESWTSVKSCTRDHKESAGGGSNTQLPLESFRSKSMGHEHDHHHDLEHVAEHIHGSLLASVILLSALSVHSVFDGLAIGISCGKSELLSITAAVLAHKGFAGYALGSSMVASEMNERHYFVLVLLFSSCSPIGILLGTVFEQQRWNGLSDGSEWWNIVGSGTINATVAGTFLYISIVEIGLKEILVNRDSNLLGTRLDRNQMQWSKLAAFLFGYLAMSSLAFFI